MDLPFHPKSCDSPSQVDQVLLEPLGQIMGVMKDTIITAMAARGWEKDRIVDCFSKPFDTFIGPQAARASVWMRDDREQGGVWLLDGNFTSAGENVLAMSSLYLPADLTNDEVVSKVSRLIEQMEEAVSQAFSVRMIPAHTDCGERPAG